MLEVGLKIKKYLDEKGISQAHISRELEMDPVKLNLSLNGKRKFTFPEYELLCGVLNVDTNFFLKPRLPKKKEVE